MEKQFEDVSYQNYLLQKTDEKIKKAVTELDNLKKKKGVTQKLVDNRPILATVK